MHLFIEPWFELLLGVFEYNLHSGAPDISSGFSVMCFVVFVCLLVIELSLLL